MAATVYERDNSGANRSPSAKTVLVSGFHAVDSGLKLLDSRFLISGTWILDYNHKRDSGILELNSGFQRPGLRIPHGNSG